MRDMKAPEPKQFTMMLAHLFVILTEIVLFVRVVFSWLDADITNSFVRWVYSMSEPLMQPFRGLFPDVSYPNEHVLEFPVLFAMMAYAFVVYLVAATLAWLPSVEMPRVKK